MALYIFLKICCPNRGRESFTAGGATEVGGASAVGCGGGMTAKMYDRRKKQQYNFIQNHTLAGNLLV